MKKVLSIILMALILTAAFATTGEDSFYVRAYKIGNYGAKYFEVTLFDALTGTLQTIGTDYDTLDLTTYSNKLMNPIANDSSYSVDKYSDHVIFSFRFSGNASTNSRLTCSISISPLTNTTNSSKKITAYYEMRDLTCVFTSNYKKTTPEGGSTSVTASTDHVTVSTTNQSLGFYWTVNTGSADLENWRTQGSVGIAINNSSYEAAPVGEYRATVTIGVTAT